MSLLPFFFDYDDSTPSMLSSQFWPRFPRDEFFMRPQKTWRQMLEKSQDVGAKTVVNKNGFQVNINVCQFAPEEVDVKIVGNEITVEGKHEEKQDEHGFISRHFVRRYVIPEGHDAETASSTLSSDGVLTISVRKALMPGENARSIPITQTGNAYKPLKEKENLRSADKTD